MFGVVYVIVIDCVFECLVMVEVVGCQMINYEKEDVLFFLCEVIGGCGFDYVIDVVGMEVYGYGFGFIMDKVQQNFKLIFDCIIVLCWVILSCVKGGIVSMLGVYGGLVDKMFIGVVFVKGLIFCMG